MRFAAILLALLLATAGFPAAAADLELHPAPSAPQHAVPQPTESEFDALKPKDGANNPAGETWWREMVRKAPACEAFSDGCRICKKNETGFACSNIPIACQPKEWACSAP